MKGLWRLLALLTFVLVACGPTATPTPAAQSAPTGATIASAQASTHIGERGTVCGLVVDTRYATGSRGSPTFLNFDRPYPNHPFVVVIWGSDRGKFPASPESHYKNEQVCATGLIESYQGKPQVISRAASQLQVMR